MQPFPSDWSLWRREGPGEVEPLVGRWNKTEAVESCERRIAENYY